MGMYINPGNEGFAGIRNGRYVDKSGLIRLVNETIDTPERLTCISRPRRFGKSYAARMLTAYYDCTCDSHRLFGDLAIAQDENYEKHLNQYNVICLEITSFISNARRQGISLREVPNMIAAAVQKELKSAFSCQTEGQSLTESLVRIAEELNGKKFVFIIDEWDALMREGKDDAVAQRRYLDLLREWFKNSTFTPRAVAAAYMTGILPIKKDGSQSAISEFNEYTMIQPGEYTTYIGFTETEVNDLCQEKGIDFGRMKEWYDGYHFKKMSSVYNPNSVMRAIRNGEFDSYWVQTSAAESLLTYIDMDEEGMQDDVARLISGEEIEVQTEGFENDFQTFHDKNDVLTLMIHLGYLTYSRDEGGTGWVRIPNEEVRREFHRMLRRSQHRELIRLVRESDELLQKTIEGDEAAVAKAISRVHDSNYAPQYYHNEQSLRATIRLAYLSCVDQYMKIEELPSGHGVADLVFLPKRRSMLPALLMELKWNQTEHAAIAQIKERNYPAVLKNFGGEILLVGINYDVKTKIHTCQIEHIESE